MSIAHNPQQISSALILGAALWSACGAEPNEGAQQATTAGSSSIAGSTASVVSAAGSESAAVGGASGGALNAGASDNGGNGGTLSVAGTVSVAGTSGAASAASSGGASAGGTAAGGAGAAAGSASTAGAGNVGAAGANNCNLPATVSFKNDIQKPFLITSCGGANCHVVDASSTVANGGFNHGYDWITAGAHTSSCPDAPKRFQVVLDVIHGANPPSCSKSRQMPPPGSTQAVLTTCQIAALQAWLAEPMVLQTHRADDSSPTTPYLMPPFN
jgi:hypothetical protein